MCHPSSLNFGNQGKEIHYKCIILLLSNMGTRERRIIINASSFFFKLWEPGKGESLQMRHPSSLNFGNQGKEIHYKCIILLLSNMGTRERRIIINVSSFFFKLWEPGKGESLQMRHPSYLNFGNQGKEDHNKCVILVL
jgi:hypothetical protein